MKHWPATFFELLPLEALFRQCLKRNLSNIETLRLEVGVRCESRLEEFRSEDARIKPRDLYVSMNCYRKPATKTGGIVQGKARSPSVGRLSNLTARPRCAVWGM